MALKALPVSSRTASVEKKKNAWSRLIGPPTLPPKSFRLKSALGAFGFSKKPRARRFSLRWNSKRLPLHRLVPPLVMMLTVVKEPSAGEVHDEAEDRHDRGIGEIDGDRLR